MTPEQKEQIDGMDYTTLLRLSRYSPADHPLFIGERGKYFDKKLKEKRGQITYYQHAEISKKVGWQSFKKD